MTANRMRYSANEYLRNTFYQLPKFLFDDEFKALSNDAKILYALMHDRTELSMANGYIDDRNHVYLIMTREEMCEMLGVCLKTALKSINALKEYDLMEEERPGVGRPNRIYLLQVKTCKIYRSGDVKITAHDTHNLQPNDTNSNKTDFNDTLSKKELPQMREAKRENYDEIAETFAGSDGRLRDALIGYIQMRAMIHKPLSNYALKKLLQTLKDMPGDKTAIIDNSTTHNYLEFYVPRSDDGGGSFHTDEFFNLAVENTKKKYKPDAKT